MELKLSVRTVLQYSLIYLLLLCHDAGIYRINSITIRYIILFGTIIVLFIYKVHVPQKVWMYGASVIMIMKFLKLIHSDNTFDYELNILLEHLLIAYTSFAIDKKNFTTRFLKTIVLFAGVSLICFAMANVVPEILEKILISKYELPWAGGYTVYAKGWMFYVYRSFELFRNCGIYTEPGVYQIVLSVSLYILLFCNSAINVSKNIQLIWIVIVIITIITTTSTTGYISLVILLLTGALQNKKLFPNHRKIRCLFSIAILLLIGDWIFNGESSIIKINVLDKLETMANISEGALSPETIWNSSGNARLAVLMETIPLIFTKPFGIGFSSFYGLLNNLYGGNAAGARLLVYISSMGLLSLCVILFPLFRRVFQYRGSIYAFIAYVFLFLNTGFAQSKAIYASFVVIPFILEYIGESRT